VEEYRYRQLRRCGYFRKYLVTSIFLMRWSKKSSNRMAACTEQRFGIASEGNGKGS
jgi:hypothetical protein